MPLNFLNTGYFADKVGIGTNSPDAKLHVEGGIGIFNVSDDWQQSTLGTYLFRGANFATTISNETSTLKIFPATASSRAIGNYWGGINFMHLDPENSNWGTAFAGSQFWIGGRITSLPGQELSALVFATNSSNTAGSSPTEKMVILPNGNVGIGVASPDAILSVAKSDFTTTFTSADAYIRIGDRENGANKYQFIGFGYNDTAASQVPAYFGFQQTGTPGNYTKGDLVFGTRNVTTDTEATERMRITSAGGISFGSTGTAYGTSGQVLTSAGNASPTWTTPTTGTVTGTGVAGEVAYWTSSTNIANNAGMSFSSEQLQLNGVGGADGFTLPYDENPGYSNMSAGGFGILFRETHDNYITGNAYWYKTGGTASWRAKYSAYAATIIGSDNGNITFETAPANTTAPHTLTFSPRMVIKEGGNVGIGLTDPDSKLDINAGVLNITAGPAVRISKGASPVGLIRYDTLVIEANDVPTIRIGESDNTVSTIMSGDNNMRINSTDPIKFYTAGTTTGEGHNGQGGTFAMIIDNSQKVGIGVTAPNAKLHIAGGSAGMFLSNLGDNSAYDSIKMSYGGYNSGTPEFIFTQTSTPGSGIANTWYRFKNTNGVEGTNPNNVANVTIGGKLGVGTDNPQSKLQVAGGIQMADDTATASATKVGTMRYRTGTEYVEVTGTELVTNGDFATDSDWTKGTGVTIASGVGTWTNTANNVGLTQLITFTANAYYRCNVTVSNYSSGSFRFRYPGISSPRITANGTYSLIIQANQATNDTLYLQGETNGDANVNLSIDNVSVIEVTAEDASYADMCMQTGASTYEWVNIVRNTY